MKEDAPLPHLTATSVSHLASSWSDGGLWADVTTLAQLFFAATDDEAATLRWHHLVLAIGNFKRQPGRRLRPAALPPTELCSVTSSFVAPGCDFVLGVGDPASWQALESGMRGAGTATVTTLLAALWPTEHFVFDWRVHAAAVALRMSDERSAGGSVPVANDVPLTMVQYAVVRAWLLATAAELDQPLTTIERALYRLSQQVPPATGRSWADCAPLILAEAQKADLGHPA